jgi:hypothetical protein
MGDRGQPFWWGEAPERPYNSAGVATICFLEMPICLKTRRAVIKRLATARRVFGLINIMRKKDVRRSAAIVQPFGSLAPPKDTPYQILNWLTTA